MASASPLKHSASSSSSSASTSAPGEESVKVVVRVRPLGQKERQDGHFIVTQADESSGEIVVQNPADGGSPGSVPKSFTFDAVFGEASTQQQVYDSCAAPVVESVLNGFNGTIFAFGQTGTGKTHTMEGCGDAPTERGIIPRSFQHIFDRLGVSENQQFLVRASYLEIYNEEIRDLLAKDPRNKLELKEHPDRGVYVKDLTSFVVKNAAEIDKVMQAGKTNRSTGATLMNQASSRSHSVFTIIVECSGGGAGSKPPSSSEAKPTHKQRIRVGKLNLVDLAGSERQSKTGTTGERFKEATKINLSLSALGNVISALVDGRAQHVPYRDSKLTRLLQDSLGGNTKTVMCANCGPSDYNYNETLSSLRYASRAKKIKNKPHVNEDPKDTMLRQFQEEIERLKAQLAAAAGSHQPPSVPLGLLDSSAQAKEDGEGDASGTHRRWNSSNVEKALREVAAKAEKEKEELKSQAKRDMGELQSKSLEEKEALRQRLTKEAEDRRVLEERLRAMEAKLIQGGELVDKASKQELMLQKTKGDLDAQHQQQRRLAQELAIKEETHLVLEEQYSSLQEEVDAKTRKLTKLWAKHQAATHEVQDLQHEFQREREDWLETVRQLNRQLKLKELVIQNFVPPEVAAKIEQRASWHEERETWVVPHLAAAGNNVPVDLRRPVSMPGLRRPETRAARARRAAGDKDPRYRADDLLDLALDMEDGAPALQHYRGAATVYPAIDTILDMSLEGGDGDEEAERLVFGAAAGADEGDDVAGAPTPYLKYAYHHQVATGAGDEGDGAR